MSAPRRFRPHRLPGLLLAGLAAALALVIAVAASVPATAAAPLTGRHAAAAGKASAHRTVAKVARKTPRHKKKPVHKKKRPPKKLVRKAAPKKPAPAKKPAPTSPSPTPTATTLPAGQVAFGAYAAGYSGSGSQLSQFEQLLGARVAIASSFRGWGDVFPDAAQQVDADSGHVLMVSWDLGATADTRFSTFPAHAHDAYLAEEADAARTFGKPLYVRPWPEMNGDWQPFQPTASGSAPAGGTYAEFIAAWRYLVTFFRDHGATNVKWIFNPTADTYAETTDVRAIWPGSAYVDVLGIDGYNWGTGGIFQWRSFADVFTTQYQRLTSLSSTQPVWICEFGSKEPAENDGAPIDPAHTKASWYAGVWSFLAGAPRIRAAVLFNVRKERDWRVESDAGALRSLQQQAAVAARSVS